MAATGVIAKKMLRQSNACSSQPPTIGPSAIAAPVIAPHKPIASARSRRSVNTFEISDSVEGNTIAAPTPITERAAISAPALSVSPPARLARPKTDRPASSIPLRPNRSERLPMASIDPANSKLNASTTHCSCELDAMQLANERRQRDVDDRRVEIDHNRRQQQRDQDHWLASHDVSGESTSHPPHGHVGVRAWGSSGRTIRGSGPDPEDRMTRRSFDRQITAAVVASRADSVTPTAAGSGSLSGCERLASRAADDRNERSSRALA